MATCAADQNYVRMHREATLDPEARAVELVQWALEQAAIERHQGDLSLRIIVYSRVEIGSSWL